VFLFSVAGALRGQPTSRLAYIHRDPKIQGGVPVFVGTRVPLKNLFDSIEAGDSLDQFLEDYPSVSREQALAALELAQEAASEHAPAA
jgi:uncharacterized protein (DUF433 family)